MELLKLEYEEIKTLWSTWKSLKDTELEAVIANVDSTQWMAILSHLRSLGLQEEPQQPYLDILLQNGLRFRMTGEDAVRKYCQTNRLPDTATCTMKGRIADVMPVQLRDYELRVKLRREQQVGRNEIKFQEALLQWQMLPKSFRYIRRYTLTTPKGSGAKFDLSIVRQSPYDSTKQFAKATNFQESDILRRPLTYEVEIEAIREEAGDEPMPLISKIGQALQGKQGAFVVIRKPLRDMVLAGLKNIFGQNNEFPGPKAVTLEKQNLLPREEVGPDTISLITLKGGYNVTDKADGLRTMMYVHSDGMIYLVDMNMKIYGTGLQTDPAVWIGTILDGEWVRKTKTGELHNTFYAFDIFTTRGGVDVRDRPFFKSALENQDVTQDGRHRLLQEAIAGLAVSKQAVRLPLSQQMSISIKNFKAALPGTPTRQIFIEAAAILDDAKQAVYATDGLIFTPNAMALPTRPGTWKAQFKWKPASHNTVDFLCVSERVKTDSGESTDDELVRTEIRSDTNEVVTYKTLRLFVGSTRDSGKKNPRQTILENQPLPTDESRDYRPVIFYPKDPSDVYASICHIAVDVGGSETDIAQSIIRCTDTGEPISTNSIIEMSYDPSAAPGWRWIPRRIRWDKTDSYRRGFIGGSLNAEKVADSIWASLHDGITEEMIRTGNMIITEEEQTEAVPQPLPPPELTYVNKRSDSNEAVVATLRQFHNYIKNTMLFGRVMQSKDSLLDLACGKGSDIHKWTSGGLGWILGVDLAEDSLNNPRNGAYARYMQKRIEYSATPPMVFVQGNVTRPLSTGDAGISSQDQTMLRSLYNTPLAGAIPPPFLETNGLTGKASEKFQIISCMFAIHYFFQDRMMVDGFLANIAENLKLGGYFIGCCFDGETVFNQLANLPLGGVRTGKENDVVMWNIEKAYDSVMDERVLPDTDSGLGRAIDVDFITIGEKHREYLVNFRYLRNRLAEIGIDILEASEMKELNLKESTGLFSTTHKFVKDRFPMSAKLREFSFLNRWFIFRRRSFAPLSQALADVSSGSRPIVLPTLPPQINTSRGRGRGRGGITATRGGRGSAMATSRLPLRTEEIVTNPSRGGRGRGSNR
jgi:hypothetical protein